MELAHSNDLEIPGFTERRLKVAADYAAPSKRDTGTAASRKVPSILLKGLWLQQAGFEIDDAITVRVIKGCLVITRPDDAISAVTDDYVYPQHSTGLRLN